MAVFAEKQGAAWGKNRKFQENTAYWLRRAVIGSIEEALRAGI
jgi:hypothetical protein